MEEKQISQGQSLKEQQVVSPRDICFSSIEYFQSSIYLSCPRFVNFNPALQRTLPVITGASIARRVTQRAMICHHRWYMWLLHWMIQSLIHLRCPRFVNSYRSLHITHLMSCKLLQYLVELHLIRQIPCQCHPQIMEVAIFMNTWLMCLSWHWHNDNSMPWWYFSIIKSCVTWMTLHKCLYIHLLFPTLNHCLNSPYHHWNCG